MTYWVYWEGAKAVMMFPNLSPVTGAGNPNS